jgi:hypothetical protein
MTTCARMSAANEPARLSPTDGASPRLGRAQSRPARSRRNGDTTFDTPVSNVPSTTLSGDPQGLPRPVGNGGAFQPLGREHPIGARPAPKVFSSNVSGAGRRAGEVR